MQLIYDMAPKIKAKRSEIFFSSSPCSLRNGSPDAQLVGESLYIRPVIDVNRLIIENPKVSAYIN
jgi:hypothetical protein